MKLLKCHIVTVTGFIKGWRTSKIMPGCKANNCNVTRYMESVHFYYWFKYIYDLWKNRTMISELSQMKSVRNTFNRSEICDFYSCGDSEDKKYDRQCLLRVAFGFKALTKLRLVPVYSFLHVRLAYFFRLISVCTLFFWKCRTSQEK